ncbi:uncharacterized protein IWZ02DRAFT_472627 [Phyllosticta citriasiana]|uniref:uncharacterized protein n=1 Tax=Phyllosticta citriasiana TaxID=595635 RepID=UPI0030FDC248
MAEGSRLRGFCILLRNLFLAALLYTCILSIINLARNPSSRPTGKLGIPAFLGKSGPVDVIKPTKSGVKVNVTINPHANRRCCKDDYLGPRPHVDTEADLKLLVEECRGSYAGIEKMKTFPEPTARASAQDPRKAEYNDADGHGNNLDKYLPLTNATKASKVSIGSCPGPIIPYHVYWTGPATWRVGKSGVLAPLPVARRGQGPNAVDDMLTGTPCSLASCPWSSVETSPSRPGSFLSASRLPKNVDHNDGARVSRGRPNSQGEVTIADGVIEDKNGSTLGCHPHPGDYNTAVMSLTANSSLSSYLLRGGVRMGLNFHPRVIGRMAWKDGRDQEFLMLETAAFDPIWTEFNWDREGRCTVPCLKDYSAAFKGKTNSIKDEWQSYDGPQLDHVDLSQQRPRTRIQSQNVVKGRGPSAEPSRPGSDAPHSAAEQPGADHSDSFTATSAEEAELRKKGVWLKHPEPSSWINVIEIAHDAFFAGTRTNPYGETWDGPDLMPYNFWPEFV